MIRSKPKEVTLFSLSLFLVLAYGASIWTWMRIPSSPVTWYILPLICFTIAVVVSIKVLLSYRVLVVDNDHWQVTRLVGSKIKFSGKEIEWWKEIEIKTMGGLYKQLQVFAGKGKNVKISLQEHTEYQGVLKSLRKRHSRKQIEEKN
ncbi:MAG: hypothetical protein DHS20C17_15280 [Cyclobacteriaceae bacterium]|nr:MAG: hypothetical protein DHS20C17_15280 [Cyclobacteriaceae bacterium]